MADIFDLADTWNDGATTFTAIKMDVTDTASAAGSKLLDLQIGSTPIFEVLKNRSFNLYNTYTDASNYERLRIGAASNIFEIFAEAAGTGTRRNISIYGQSVILDGPSDSAYLLRRAGATQIAAGSAGPRFFMPPYPGSTIVDIGLAAFPFRDIFLRPSSSLTPVANGDLVIEATNNTTLAFKLKGSDGTVRSGTVALS